MNTLADFVRLGMVERTLWEALLLMIGAAAFCTGAFAFAAISRAR